MEFGVRTFLLSCIAAVFVAFARVPIAFAQMPFACTVLPAANSEKTFSTNHNIPADLYSDQSLLYTFQVTTPNWQNRARNFEIKLCLTNDTLNYCSSGHGTVTQLGAITREIPVSEIAGGTFHAVLTGVKEGESSSSDLCRIDNALIMTNAETVKRDPDCSKFSFDPDPLTPSRHEVTISYDSTGLTDYYPYYIFFNNGTVMQSSSNFSKVTNPGIFSFNVSAIDPSVNAYIRLIRRGTQFGSQFPDEIVCTKRLIYDSGTGTTTPGEGTTEEHSAQFALCMQTADAPRNVSAEQACSSGGDPTTDYGRCCTCFVGETPGIWTAFGCVKTSKEGIVTSFVKIGLGLAGGFVLLSILWGSFLLTTSSGEPKRVQEGQEMISSAVMGIMFIIFSVIILRFIGIDILRIPGFGDRGI